ncbi:PspC domain-containing protein [Mucilaginibacter psychrotolerans]|uniref:PspC domain-containing protein n=1 Tax=Mucilaginibacter psychrotolerans TaxID=1524096 RepID=A0A4Y8SGE5_9SPHI|nr:PspC domain-containing protein [Mucilaginibacter psychrotolerans]TFF37988.1 PspC domain-containing protein [Mucilaginibacter psychrotolerans]
MEKKLYRNEYGKMIGGVCSGIADYLGIDPTIVRLVFVVLFVTHGAGFLMYIILLVVLPKNNSFVNPNFRPGVDDKDYQVPPTQPFGQPFNQPFGFPPVAPKKSSNAGMIFGAVLIVLGTIFLADELNFIPDWDFDKLWPLIIVGAGAALIFAGKKKEPWEKHDWNATSATTATEVTEDDKPKASAFDLSKKTDEPSTDNPTTI